MHSRRQFLKACAAGLASIGATPVFALSRHAGARRLSFNNLHTGERLSATYWSDGEYSAQALTQIDWVLRDFRTGATKPIDPTLLDLLYRLKQRIGVNRSYEVISAYRSPATNARLRAQGSGLAKRSLHMHGMAIDVRVPGFSLEKLRSAAMALRGGGVGYYPRSDFVHIDTGRVRYW